MEGLLKTKSVLVVFLLCASLLIVTDAQLFEVLGQQKQSIFKKHSREAKIRQIVTPLLALGTMLNVIDQPFI